MISRTRYLIDSGFLFAMADPDDEHHIEAERLRLPPGSVKIVPDVVLTEACYMIGRFISHRAMMNFLHAFSMSDAQLEPVNMDDLERARNHGKVRRCATRLRGLLHHGFGRETQHRTDLYL